jgi:Tfp pilus assembly protein PilF
LPASITNSAPGNWATAQACERRLGFTDWNYFSILEDVLSRLGQAPFTNQLNHSTQVQAIRARMNEVREQMTRESPETVRAVYRGAIQSAPDDYHIYENFAEFLEVRGDLAEAEAQWERVRELIPHHYVAYLQAGRLALRLAKFPEAKMRLEEALRLDSKNQQAADLAAKARQAMKK